MPWLSRNVARVNNDILLKKDLIEGQREKQRYDYSDLLELPWFYKRWQRRTKSQFDSEAKEYAKTKPVVFGAPYWPNMKSTDL